MTEEMFTAVRQMTVRDLKKILDGFPDESRIYVDDRDYEEQPARGVYDIPQYRWVTPKGNVKIGIRAPKGRAAEKLPPIVVVV